MAGKSVNENKADRFKRIAARRTQNVLEALRKIGNCSNRGIYSYSDEDVSKMFSAIDSEIRRIKVLFNAKEKSNKFSF